MAEAINCSEKNDDDLKSDSERETISKKLSHLQKKLLTPLKEDISDWINTTLGEVVINADRFIENLDTGVILCKLSLMIDKKAQEYFKKDDCLEEGLPAYRLHCNESASPGTWYARDNIANFLMWCRAYGMADDTLFESEDLVAHRHERQVIFCLMELARLGALHGLEPPSLITMEQEIDSEVESPMSLDYPWSDVEEAEPTFQRNDVPNSMEPLKILIMPPAAKEAAPLDAEVYKVSQQFDCADYVIKLSEGVFNVFGKQVFIRLLKGKHLMIRVGGGWDTFENYLIHHIPIKILKFHHGSQNKDALSSTSCESNTSLEYFVIRSKYQSSSFIAGQKHDS